ncbi:MAG TPA: hypothetical protein VJ953_13890, partial [Saprospiraceae bacterium]|nr:hypothetical protein [Saprospiraceae bacterium]
MRTPALIILIFFTTHLSAQPALLKAPQHAAQDLVFRLTGEQVKTIFSTKGTPDFDYQYLGQLIDSIPYGKPLPDTFPNGHYLRLSLVKDRVETEIYTIQPFQLHLLNNARDFSLQLTDSLGQIISDAKVKINYRKVRFDEISQTYRLKKSNQQGLLSISWSGQTYYYQVDRTYNRSFLNRLGKGYIQYGLVRYLWRPVRFAAALPVESVQSLIQNYPTYRMRQTGNFFSRLYYKIACIFDPYYCDSYGRTSPQYEGFLLTDKPIYRPGDTLFWKAYLLKRRNGKPFQKPIELQLHNLGKLRWSSRALIPQSPGNYHDYLVLEDSLNLRLDSYLSFQLSHQEESLIYSSVRYEDYELGRSQLSARALKNKAYRGDSIQFEVSALDDNARPLVGAELKVFLLTKQVEKHLSDRLFLPDTLLEHSLFLEAEKNTPIKFPTTDFPTANFTITAHFELLSADKERLTKQLDLEFYQEERLVSYTLDEDTLNFHLKENGQSIRDTLTMLTRDQDGKILHREVIALPLKWPLETQVWDYTFEQNTWKDQLRLKEEEASLQFSTNRQDNEVSIKAINPHRLPFHYFFYELDKEIARGYTTDLDTIWEAGIQKNTYLAVQYLWRGEIIEHNYEISGQSDALEISWSIPTQVEPGEQVPISLSVKDESGKPRADVDISLFALTSKFQDYQLPDIPDQTKALRKRIVFNSFRLLPKPQNLASTSLNYEFWQTLTDLDQNLYYQFRFPQDTIYQFSYPAQDSITQFAPFIDGQAVYIIEVDNSPVFFNWTTNKQPYSFRIGAGRHHIRLRLR